jgi:flagellin-like protein
MKIRYGTTRRRAITPIIATVLIIAVTLIAAVAIGGFVFGIFGSATSVAQVTVVGASLSHPTSGSTPWASTGVTCAASPSGNYLQLTNTGTASTVASTMSITYGGSTYSTNFGNAGAACTVPSGGSLYITITAAGFPASATSGQQFTGFVVMSNGAQVVYTGVFS